MELTVISVVDTAVKIGLGALISSVYGYFSLSKSHRHDEKIIRDRIVFEFQENRIRRYVDFISKSQCLLQLSIYNRADPSSDNYLEFIRAFNELQIVSSDEMRRSAWDVMGAVDNFIFHSKNDEVGISTQLMSEAKEKIAYFQKLAQLEVVGFIHK